MESRESYLENLRLILERDFIVMIMYLFVIEIIIIENVFEDGLICIN